MNLLPILIAIINCTRTTRTPSTSYSNQDVFSQAQNLATRNANRFNRPSLANKGWAATKRLSGNLASKARSSGRMRYQALKAGANRKWTSQKEKFRAYGASPTKKVVIHPDYINNFPYPGELIPKKLRQELEILNNEAASLKDYTLSKKGKAQYLESYLRLNNGFVRAMLVGDFSMIKYVLDLKTTD